MLWIKYETLEFFSDLYYIIYVIDLLLMYN